MREYLVATLVIIVVIVIPLGLVFNELRAYYFIKCEDASTKGSVLVSYGVLPRDCKR